MGVTWWRLRETEIRETRGDLGRQGTLGETRKTEGDGGGLGEGSGRFGDGQGKLGEVCRSYLKKACQTDRQTDMASPRGATAPNKCEMRQGERRGNNIILFRCGSTSRPSHVRPSV